MRISACITVLNEEDWIYLTIKSIYDFVDHIIIVEGTEDNMKFSASKTGLSVDRTAEIIRTFPDIHRKIIFKQVGKVPWIGDLRNEGLKLVPKNTDWLLNMGGDQLFNYNELLLTRDYLKRFNDVTVYYINHLFFWQDIYHIKVHESLLPMTVPKFYRYYPDIRCGDIGRDDTDLYSGDTSIRKLGKSVHIPMVNLFHLGYARGASKLFRKSIWNKIYIEKMPANKLPEICNKVQKEDPIFKDKSNDIYVFKFAGELPYKNEVVAQWNRIRGL